MSTKNISEKITDVIGTPLSLLLHSLFFLFMFLSPFFGIDSQRMLLVLTTILSVEAIYLALFIQMTVSRTSDDIEGVEKDIDLIQADEKKDDRHIADLAQSMQNIEQRLEQLQQDVLKLKQ